MVADIDPVNMLVRTTPTSTRKGVAAPGGGVDALNLV